MVRFGRTLTCRESGRYWWLTNSETGLVGQVFMNRLEKARFSKPGSHRKGKVQTIRCSESEREPRFQHCRGTGTYFRFT